MTAETYKPDPDQEQTSTDKNEVDDDYDEVALFFDECRGDKEVQALNESIEAVGSQTNINTGRN